MKTHTIYASGPVTEDNSFQLDGDHVRVTAVDEQGGTRTVYVTSKSQATMLMHQLQAILGGR